MRRGSACSHCMDHQPESERRVIMYMLEDSTGSGIDGDASTKVPEAKEAAERPNRSEMDGNASVKVSKAGKDAERPTRSEIDSNVTTAEVCEELSSGAEFDK